MMVVEGCCNISPESDIEDREIHAIQEGLQDLVKIWVQNVDIYLCVDNQNALSALASGPNGGKEDIKACLEDVKTLQTRGCKVNEKWTPSQEMIPGNERADTLAKAGTKRNICKWARTTLTLLQSRPYHYMMISWQQRDDLPTRHSIVPFPPTRNMPRQSSRAIARLRTGLTTLDPTSRNPPTPCACAVASQSAQLTLLHCSLPNVVVA